MIKTPKKISDIQELLRARLQKGEWEAGDRLPTDTDLARELGCSVGTVSKALGLLAHDGMVARKPRVGTTVLGTSPSSLQLDAFAFIYPSDQHEGVSQMLHAFEAAARQKGRRLMMLPTGIEFDKESEIVLRLDEFDIQGAVACPVVSSPKEQLQFCQLLLKSKVPIVLAGLNLPGFSVAAVLMDDFHAGYETTRHLLEKGCRRIGFLTNSSWSLGMRDRYSGYRKAMEEAGIEIQPSWVQRNAETRVDIEHPTKESRAIAAQYLKSRPNVDALACGDVFMAIGVLEEAARLGIRVPDDLKVTGIDDFEVAKNCKPSLTTYRTPFREIGEQSFANLEALITGGSKHPEAEDETLIRGSICARGST